MADAQDKALSIIRGGPQSEEPGMGPLTLGGYIREVTSRYAEREALVMRTPQGVERWTYADLWERSFSVAKALTACGLGKGDRVGVLMTNRSEWLAATFGASLAGCVAVTLSTFSTQAELDYLLKTSCVSVLLFERGVLKKDFAEMLAGLEPAIAAASPGALQSRRYPFLRHLAMVGRTGVGGAIEDWDVFLARGAATPADLVDARAASIHPSDPGVLFFSSGSTAKPKGILSAHRGVSIQLWRWPRIFSLHGDIRCWAANGFFWSGNFGMAIGGTLSCGGAIVLQSTFDPVEALQLMETEKVNFALAWPHQWAQLEAAPNWATVDLGSLHFIDRTTVLARHPTVHTDWREAYAAYGNTETFTINSIFPSGTPEEEIAGSHGRALPGNTIKIVDPLSGETVPRGVSGEIAVKGPTLMLGYVGIPLDETLDDEGFFRTGDGGHIDDQDRLHWAGRLNDIIKTGGANVSPLEIDEAMMTISGVKMARAVGVPHDTLGELVVACIVPHEGATLDEDGIRNLLKERLASYKVPRRVLFFGEGELALTGSAKIKAADLRVLAAKRIGAE